MSDRPIKLIRDYATQAPSERSYLLEAGELAETFRDKLEFVHLDEYWSETIKGHKMKKASFVGRK